jgi:hypothetical protein
MIPPQHAGLFALREVCALLGADVPTAVQLVRQEPALLDVPAKTLENNIRVRHGDASKQALSEGGCWSLGLCRILGSADAHASSWEGVTSMCGVSKDCSCSYVASTICLH